MTNIVLRAPPHSAFVFNCQMGRGRTTTGMVIASLAYLKRIGATDPAGDDSLEDTPAGTVPEWLEDGVQQSLNSQVRPRCLCALSAHPGQGLLDLCTHAKAANRSTTSGSACRRRRRTEGTRRRR